MPYKPYQQKTGITSTNGSTPQSEGTTPTAMAKQEDSSDVPMQTGDESTLSGGPEEASTHPGKKFFPKKFAGVGKPFKPLPNSIKKKRINFRLRKILTPKAPVMVLNEMVGAVAYTFVEPPPMANAPMFMAQCEVYDNTYSGIGPNKQVAKNICAEQAIKAVVTKKCLESRAKFVQQLEGTPDQAKHNLLEDETPWAQLASLALFKLFNDWQNSGFQVPSELLRAPDVAALTAPPVPEAPQQALKTTPQLPAKKLPENPTNRHPVQLLNELRGGVVFNVIGEAGAPPNTIFTMGLELDGKVYTGDGKNKKDAKKNCALEVLRELYKITYPSEGTNMDETV